MSTIPPLASDKTLLAQGIDALDAGISVFDANLCLIAANRRLAELFEFPPHLMQPGTPLAELYRFNAQRGEYGDGDLESQVQTRLEIARRFEPHHFERDRPDGTVIEVRGTPLASGGFVTIYTDVTEHRQRERALQSLTTELEARVAARTAELAHQSALLQQVVSHVEHGITLVNKDLVLELCNPQFARIMRFPPVLARPGSRFEDFIRFNAERGEYGAGPVEQLVSSRVEQARHPQPHHFERSRPDGTCIEVIGTPTSDGSLVTTYIDITARKRAETALGASEQRFRDFARASSDWFFETDAQLRFSYFSERFQDVTGLAPEDLLGKQRREVAAPGAVATEPEKWRQHNEDLSQRRPYRDFQYALLGPAGQRLHISVSAVPAFDPSGAFLGYRGTGTDVTELHQAREALQHMAHYDALTDIPNRRYFEATLESTPARAARYQHRGAVIFIDLDRFKHVNDTHGHLAGDALLRNVATHLATRLRKTDFLARIGGDEFALLCECVDRDDNPLQLASELIARVLEAAAQSYPDCGVGASAGVAHFNSAGPSLDVLMQRADAAMYQAKANGRGVVCVAPDQPP